MGTNLRSDSGSFPKLQSDDTAPSHLFPNPTKQLIPHIIISGTEAEQSADEVMQASWNSVISNSNERGSQMTSPVPSDPIRTDSPLATSGTHIISSTDDSKTSSQLETSNTPDGQVMEISSQSHHRSVSFDGDTRKHPRTNNVCVPQVSYPETSLQRSMSMSQAQTTSTQHIKLSAESSREGAIVNSAGIERLKSSSCSNLNADFNQSANVSEQSSFRVKTAVLTPLLPRVKAIFVGSACSGKTSLIRCVCCVCGSCN